MKTLQVPDFALPDIEDVTRRNFLIGGAAALLLGGCGSAAEDRGSAGSGGGYPRTVRDKFEDVELESRPERIMTFGGPELDAVLALGVEPALIAAYPGWEVRSYQDGAEVIPVFDYNYDSPNIEKILAEDIDLIVTSVYPTSPVEQKRIPNNPIPVVALDQGDFEGQLLVLGRALGIEDRARERAAEIEELFAGFEPPRMPETVRAFGTYGDGTFYMFKPTSGFSRMLERFGLPALTAPEDVGDQDIDPEAVHDISFELMSELEADLLIGTGYNESPITSVVESPFFKDLEVVREGRFAGLENDESFAVAYGSVLSIPLVKEVLTRALS